MHFCKRAVLISVVAAATLSTGCATMSSRPYVIPDNAGGLVQAAAEFAKQDFLDNPPSAVTIVAMNDLIVEPEASMANAVVVAKWPDGKKAFTVTHIHFTQSGKLISAYSVFWWRALEREDGWKEAWCNFLRTSMDRYKNELEAQGCR